MSCANTYYDVPLVDRVEALEDVGGTGTGEAEEFPIARAARSSANNLLRL